MSADGTWSPAPTGASAPGPSACCSTRAAASPPTTSAAAITGCRLLLDDAELAALDQVRGDVTDLRPAARDDGGARDHARDPPGGAAGAVRARRPAARRAASTWSARSSCSRPCARLGPLAGTLTYASSIAAYDPPEPGHEHEQRGTPATLYGVFKRANEETAGVYWADHQIAEHRPAAAHGLRPRPRPGRDLGADEGHARRGRRHVVPGALRRSGRAAARARRRARSSSRPRARRSRARSCSTRPARRSRWAT